MEKITQDAGRKMLGEFAPEFAHFNDDILFGENWNNQDIDIKTRCIVTVVALISLGITDNSLIYHLQNAKNYGVSKKEIVAIVTHLSFYVGWPKAWAVFNLAKDIWSGKEEGVNEKIEHENSMIFPLGRENTEFSKYFVGKSYLAPISTKQVGIYNVTFEPGCRNNWHIHHGENGGGQILLCVAGKGYYQEWGKEVVKLEVGDVVNIPVGVKHWHGARNDSWFSHLALDVPAKNPCVEWLEKVDEKFYEEIEK